MPGTRWPDAAAAAVLALSAVEARRGVVGPVEAEAFQRLNGLPDAAHLPVAALMQAGSFGAVGAAAAVAVGLGERPLAARLAIGGTTAWLSAKVVKRRVGRGRPASVGAARILGRPAGGLGFPSGHAAVASAMATVVSASVSRPARLAACVLAATVGASRVYVGAHLPHDVVGGTALGVLVGRGALRLPVAGVPGVGGGDDRPGTPRRSGPADRVRSRRRGRH